MMVSSWPPSAAPRIGEGVSVFLDGTDGPGDTVAADDRTPQNRTPRYTADALPERGEVQDELDADRDPGGHGVVDPDSQGNQE
jgi:hypothetical protein